MAERNIRLLIAYDGTDFSGWQRQVAGRPCANGDAPSHAAQFLQAGNRADNRRPLRTVQGGIEAALEKLHRHAVGLTGSGRTDAGVHAAGQVANFYTDIQNMAPERFAPALNGLLPQDGRVLCAEEAAPSFHARFDAKSRTYRYHIIAGRHALPHEARYALQLWRRPSLSNLNAYARLLRGEMDCSTFATPKNPSESCFRYIFNAVFFTQGDSLIFEITANAFLWKMVRSIVGSLLFCEERCLTPADFAALVKSRDRAQAGPTAPAKGLFLHKVEYFSR